MSFRNSPITQNSKFQLMRWVFAYIVLSSYLFLSTLTSLSARPTGDDYCAAAINAKSGFIAGIFEIFANTPFPVGVILASLQGSLGANHLGSGTVVLALGLAIFVLVTSIYCGYTLFKENVNRYIFGGLLALGIWISFASLNSFTPQGGLVISGGWVASAFHFLPLIAIIGVVSSLNNLMGYRKGKTAFILFSFVACSSGNIGWSIYIFCLICLLLATVFPKSSNTKIVVGFISLGMAMSAAIGALAFISGAVASRSDQAGIAKTGLFFNLLELLQNPGWVSNHYLIALGQLLQPTTILIGLSLGIFFSFSCTKYLASKPGLGRPLTVFTLLAIFSPLIVVIWEGISYEGWWHFPSLSVFVFVTFFLLGAITTLKIGLQTGEKISLVITIILLCVPIYVFTKYGLPNLTSLQQRAVSWDSGIVSPVAYLADRGVPWVDECFSTVMQHQTDSQ